MIGLITKTTAKRSTSTVAGLRCFGNWRGARARLQPVACAAATGQRGEPVRERKAHLASLYCLQRGHRQLTANLVGCTSIRPPQFGQVCTEALLAVTCIAVRSFVVFLSLSTPLLRKLRAKTPLSANGLLWPFRRASSDKSCQPGTEPGPPDAQHWRPAALPARTRRVGIFVDLLSRRGNDGQHWRIGHV